MCSGSQCSFTPNWYDAAYGASGVYMTSSSADSIGMAGPNGAWPDSWGHYLTNLPAWVTTVSFNWVYWANDYGDYDRGYLFANGGWVHLASNNCTGCVSSGYYSYNVSPGGDRRFGPGVWSRDGCCGAGFLNFSNIVFR